MKSNNMARTEKIALLALLPFLTNLQAFAQPESFLSSGNFTALFMTLPTNMDESTRAQSEATFNTFVGRGDLNSDLSGLPMARSCSTDNASQQSGSNWIMKQAANARILMFNENHYTLASRAYVRSLLPELQKLGFTHMGFEAFSPLPDDLDLEAKLKLGYYTVEPMFSALVRDAAALGLTLFGYESTERAPANATSEERFTIRELGQTRNIMEQINAAPADAKFIIYAGWSHIAEEPLPGQNGTMRWMASWLREQSGIDPLTVTLVDCAYEPDEYGGWEGQLYLTESGTVQVEGSYAGKVDAQVRLPKPGVMAGDSVSFYRNLLGKRVAIPETLRSATEAVLVQARRAGAADSELAHDRILLRAGEDYPLFLKPGFWQLKSTLGDGSVVGEQLITIE